MNKFFAVIFASLSLTAFAIKPGTITVGATSVPHAQVLNEAVAPLLKAQGITLVVKEFSDYVQPNLATESGDIDANYFQHVPYLQSFTKDRNITDLISVANVHLEPLAVYSKKFKSIKDIKDKATISIPNDPSNEARALILLSKAGLIKIKDPSNLNSTITDITENKKNLQFKELNAEQIPRAIADVDFAVINANYALQAKLDSKTALLVEDPKSNPYANILVIKQADKDAPEVKALIKALTSPQVKTFIQKTYSGAVIPAF